MEWMLVRTVLSLLAVLAVMAGIVVVVKKYVYRGGATRSSTVEVEVLGHRVLAPKRSVHVLKVLDRIIVVGVTEGGMTLLTELNDEESLRRVDERIMEREKGLSPFSTFLEKYMMVFTRVGSNGNGKSGRGFIG